MNRRLGQLFFATVLACNGLAAQAANVVLDTGLIRMGVADNAGLGANGVGLVGPGGDAVTPGCLCEGWGAAAGGLSGSVYGLAGDGLTSALMTATSTSGAGLSAQSVVTMSNGLQVSHAYSSAAGGSLFKVMVTLTNSTSGSLSDVRYARTLDWDVTPGYYDGNYTTMYGGTASGPGGKVLTTSTNPFARPDPMETRGQEQDTNVTNSPGDKGGYFVFGFGNLAAGESATFDTYIGANTTVNGLLAALGSVGVEAYSYTTGNAVADGDYAPVYGYGFAGIGLAPALGTVPEPGSLALVALAGLGLLAASRRRA